MNKDLKKINRVCEICGKNVNASRFLFEKTKPSSMCVIINNSALEHLKIIKKKIYNSISKKKKQDFLDYIWEGKSISDSYKLSKLTQEEGFAIIDLNFEKKTYLRKKAL